jgi:DnaK suppressor protein
MSQRTDIDMNKYRLLLLDERGRLSGLLKQQNADEAEEAADANDNEVSSGYPSDASSDADEIAAELADRDRDEAGDEAVTGTLRQVNAALERIENGTYGVCIVTGKPIPEERLEAIPWTDVTIEGAEQEGL